MTVNHTIQQTDYNTESIYWRNRALQAEQQVSLIGAENARLTHEMDELNEQFTTLVDHCDRMTRAARNSKIPPASFKLYYALVETCPDLFSGQPTEVQIWKIRENAGWLSEKTATNFISDLQIIGAVTQYDPGKYSETLNKRVGSMTVDLEVFPFPEQMDLRTTDRAKKARDDEKKKRDDIRKALLTLQCEVCGSDQIEYTLVPICKSCGHTPTPIEGIPAAALDIKDGVELPELVEMRDDVDTTIDKQMAADVVLGEAATPGKRVEVIGGTPMYVGYSDAEMRAIWRQDVLTKKHLPIELSRDEPIPVVEPLRFGHPIPKRNCFVCKQRSWVWNAECHGGIGDWECATCQKA